MKKLSVSDEGMFIDNEFMSIFLYRDDIDLDSLTLQEEEVQDVMYISVDDLKKQMKEKTIKFDCFQEELDLLFNYIKKEMK